MSPRDGLERLVASPDESEEVRSLLEAGIADDDVGYDFEQGLSKHLAAVGAPSASPAPGAPSAPGAAAPARLASLSSKGLLVWLGVPLASLSVAAAVVLLRGHAPPHANAVSASQALASPAAAPAGETAPSEGQTSGSLSPESDAVGPSNNPPPSASSVVRARSAHASLRHRADQRGAALALSEGSGSGVAEQEATGSARTDGTIVRDLSGEWGEPAPVAAPSTRPSADAVAEERAEIDAQAREREARDAARRVAENRLQEEMDELMRAKRALSSDPKLALELTQHGERVYRHSLLSEERQHVHLLALINLGRVDEAARLAAPYLAQHPNSPFARRVRSALDAAVQRRESR